MVELDHLLKQKNNVLPLRSDYSKAMITPVLVFQSSDSTGTYYYLEGFANRVSIFCAVILLYHESIAFLFLQ